jgi:hypothetical protein
MQFVNREFIPSLILQLLCVVLIFVPKSMITISFSVSSSNNYLLHSLSLLIRQSLFVWIQFRSYLVLKDFPSCLVIRFFSKLFFPSFSFVGLCKIAQL